MYAKDLSRRGSWPNASGSWTASSSAGRLLTATSWIRKTATNLWRIKRLRRWWSAFSTCLWPVTAPRRLLKRWHRKISWRRERTNTGRRTSAFPAMWSAAKPSASMRRYRPFSKTGWMWGIWKTTRQLSAGRIGARCSSLSGHVTRSHTTTSRTSSGGLIYCSDCGCKLNMGTKTKNGKHYHYYRCSNHCLNLDKCPRLLQISHNNRIEVGRQTVIDVGPGKL